MWFSRKRLIAVSITALMAFIWSARCAAAASPSPPRPTTPPGTPAPIGSPAQCDAVYQRMNFNWAMFQRTLAKPSAAGWRFVESGLWHVAPLLGSALCSQTDKTHDRADMDAKRFQIGLLFTIIGAFTEANLKKYQNARAFTNMFHQGVASTINNSKESHEALKVVRKQRPGFDDFLTTWTKEIQNLDVLLDKLGTPKKTELNLNERPGK
jgi:hypothetical protein